MKFLPLHIKTAILVSVISIVVLLGGLLVSRANIAKQIQEEQKQIAALQAENLAEQLSRTQAPLDADSLRRLTNVVSGSRPNLISVRVWKLENGDFVESVSSDDSLPAEEINQDVQNALRSGGDSTSVKFLQNAGDDSLFRAFSPIVENNRATGAVEVIEKLDTVWTITMRYTANILIWRTLSTVVLMSLAIYLLFQKLVYQPLGKLLGAMELAKAGDLSVELKRQDRPDEFGLLSNNFNSMMSQIREMTAERTRQNEILQEKVGAATAELVQKNELLETMNLELFRTTRKMSGLERLAAAGQTAAEFAHEVGTPLNIINGHAQLLQTSVEKQSKGAERVRIITEQIRCIEKIVREMLDRTRFGKSSREPLDVNVLLRRFLTVVEPTMEEHKIVLTKAMADNLPQISGDPDRLQQVFINLFNNALDVMPDGGNLKLSTSIAGDKVTVEFADSGTGMTEETRANIFQPLFTTKGRGRGTGLGLAVVKQILDEHEAQITVESESGAGTIFHLTFPAI